MRRKANGHIGLAPCLLCVPEPEAGIAFRASGILSMLRGHPAGVLEPVR